MMCRIKEQVWFFTFGINHEHGGNYVVFKGTFESARDKMVQTFGNQWAFQYGSAKDAGVEKYSLTPLN